MPEANSKLAAWLNEHMKRHGLSQNALAAATGIGLTTINRYCNPLTENEPRLTIVLRLAKFFKDKPPLSVMAAVEFHGMSEDGVQAIVNQNSPSQQDFLSQWTIKDGSMQGLGYMEGDTVIANANETPRDGDVVICNLYAMDGKTARTAIRLFKSPSYLISAPINANALEIHEAGKTAAIFGVISELRRKRSEH